MRVIPFSIALTSLVVMAAFGGCGVDYPGEKFRCGENSECPPVLYCRATDNKCVNREQLTPSENGAQVAPNGNGNTGGNMGQNGSGQVDTGESATAGGAGGRSSGGRGGEGGQGGTKRAGGGDGGEKTGAGAAGSGSSQERTGFDCGEETCVVTADATSLMSKTRCR
jgi:hypothetical protein